MYQSYCVYHPASSGSLHHVNKRRSKPHRERRDWTDQCQSRHCLRATESRAHGRRQGIDGCGITATILKVMCNNCVHTMFDCILGDHPNYIYSLHQRTASCSRAISLILNAPLSSQSPLMSSLGRIESVHYILHS